MTIKKVEEENLPVGFQLTTFWDSSTKSFVDTYDIQNSEEAASILNPIHVQGGMGNENSKHALAAFCRETNFQIPTLCFFMTDAGYHYEDEKQSYVLNEKIQVEDLGFEFDIFKIWAEIPKERLFFFPMTFSGCLNGCMKQDYGQFAEQGNGIFMYMSNSNANIISKGMVKILTNILDRLCGETEEMLTELEGFDIYDTSQIIPLVEETKSSNREGQMICLSDNESKRSNYFSTKMEKLITLVGKGWSKRKILIEPECLLSQMKLIAYSLKYLTGDDSVKEHIELELKNIFQTIPEDQKRYLTISMNKIEELRKQVSFNNIFPFY